MSTSGDTLFQLECVLLFALDVVKGPYIHSCAPANPSELIRSFLQPPPVAAAAAAAAASTTPATFAAASANVHHSTASAQRKPDAWTEEGLNRATVFATTPRRAPATATAVGGNANSVGSFTPSSLPRDRSTPSGSAPLSMSPLLGASGITGSSSPQLYGSMPTAMTRAGNATATAASMSGAAELPRSSSLLAQRRLLGLVDTFAQEDARGFAMGASAPNNASVSEDTNTIFGVSPQTNLSESQQTLPSVSPMANSFAGLTNASMTSNTGGGGGSNSASAAAAAAMGLHVNASGQGLSYGTSSAAPWMARSAGTADDSHSNSTHNNISGGVDGDSQSLSRTAAPASSAPSTQNDSFGLAGRSGQGNATSAAHMDASASPLATPVHTPPVTAAPASPGMMPEPMAVVSRRTSEGVTLEAQHYAKPSRPQHGNAGGGRGAYSSPSMGATPTGAATEDSKITSYNDVFVPRSEFCRRVLWLYPAESGLLFLYYAEDIPGEHYQRKTLRYSLCLVFCVDEKRMTIGAGLLHQLVRPYSVVLTNIAEELREAEMKYAYMSRGLQAISTPRRPPAPRQSDIESTFAATTPSGVASAPTTATASSRATAAGSGPVLQDAERDAEDVTEEEEEGYAAGAAGSPTSADPASSAKAQKAYRFARRRVVNESSSRPDTYHLPLVERGVSASAMAVSAPRATTEADASGAGTGRNKCDAATAEHSGQTPTSFMSPLPPNTSESDASRLEVVAPSATAQRSTARKPSTSSATATTSPAMEAETSASHQPHYLEGASAAEGSSGTSGSPSYVLTSRTTTGTTPSSQFATPFSPSAQESGRDTGSGVLGRGVGGAAETSSTMAVSTSLTEAEALTISPPSSLPMRSRTVSQGGGGFHASSTPSPPLGESLGTATATTAPSPMSSILPSSGAGGVAGPFPSAAGLPFAKHPLQPPSATTSHQTGSGSNLYGSPNVPYRSTATATSASGGRSGGDYGCSHAPHIVHTLNAFITPTTAPQWTPLSELVEELYRCLRHSGDSDGGGAGCPVTTGASTTSAGAAGALEGMPGGSLAAPPPSRAALGGVGGVAGTSHGPSTRRPAGPSPIGWTRQHQQQQRAGTQQLYSPLTAMLAGGSREASWMADGTEDGGEVAQAVGRGEGGAGGRRLSGTAPSTASLHFPCAPTSFSQPQRGDFSVVHLSDRLSFHVRRMAPLQAARMVHFDHVPVPVVAYDLSMIEWMDMAVHHVFRLVDGVRTVADLVFDVAMGTTTTLAEVYAEALRCSRAQAQAEAAAAVRRASPGAEGSAQATTIGSGSGSRDKPNSRGSSVGGRGPAKRPGAPQGSRAAASPPTADAHGTGKNAAAAAKTSLHRAAQQSAPLSARTHVVSVPIDARPSLMLLPGVRYSMPTSAAAAAAAAAISDGQAPPPSHVNVRISPASPDPANEASLLSPLATSGSTALAKNGTSLSAGMPSSTASAAARPNGAGAPSTPPPPPDISVELPTTWVATTGIVVEALLHLELCHLIKIYRPWTEATLYTAAPALQRVLRNVRHPARHILAHHLLHVAWMERQQFRRERQAQRCVAAAATAAQAAQEDTQQQQQQQQNQQRRGETDATRRPPSLIEQQADKEASASLSPEHPSSTLAPRSSQPQWHPHHHPQQTAKATLLAPLSNPSAVSRAAGTPIVASLGGRGGAVALPSPSDGTSWLPAAVTIPTPTSVPPAGSHGDTHAPAVSLHTPQHASRSPPYNTASSVLSSGASSLPRPPPSSSAAGGSGSGGGLDVGSNANTHASSVSTSYTPSCSLRHTVRVGASGKLQMNLTSSLPTSPMLHPGTASVGGGGPTQRTVGSHHTQRGLVDILPPPADPVYAPPHQRHAHPHGYVHPVPNPGIHSAETSFESSSSSDSSSRISSATSRGMSDDDFHGSRHPRARTTGVHVAQTAKQPSSVSSSPSSSNTSSRTSSQRHASSPALFSKKASPPDSRGLGHGSRSASSSRSASRAPSASTSPLSKQRNAARGDHQSHDLPTLLVTLATSRADAPHHAVVPTHSKERSLLLAGPREQGGSHKALRKMGAAGERCGGVADGTDSLGVDASLSDVQNQPNACRLSSTSSASPPQTNPTRLDGGTAGEKTKTAPKITKQNPVLRLFVPSDAEVAQAAAAALCALAKFSNTSVASVQAEMRRMPVWAPSFNRWSDRCVRAMVEVAVLNNWLEDVSQ